MSVALVIGNGESRSKIDIEKFSPEYSLIGCNAIHRDAKVDHLVCCDRRMIDEAVESDNATNTKIYVRSNWFKYYRKIKKDKRIELLPDLPYEGNKKEDQPVHWGSGPYAVLLAAALNHDTIMLVGFDLYSSNNNVNNLYKGTKNYSRKDSRPVDPSFWIYQISRVFKNFRNKDFIIWNKKDWEIPELWKQPNVRFEEID